MSCAELLTHIGGEGLPIEVVPLDVTDGRSVEDCVLRVIDVASRIDVLVNNAAALFLAATEDSDETRSRTVMETNLVGPLRLTRAVLPYMRARSSGRIINVSSLNAAKGSAFVGVYSASKSALEALSTALAFEVGPVGIGVPIVAPGVPHRHRLQDGRERTTLHRIPWRRQRAREDTQRVCLAPRDRVANAIVRAA
jgi:NAD(P)-dependent dehydrogenase (short-subunit alcohol dehydrogenase family)